MAIVKIQHRRGNYADYDPSKVLPGELVVTQADDPNSSDGEAVYIATTAGNVKRLAVAEELDSAIETALQDAIPEVVSEATQEAEAAADRAEAAAQTLEIDTTLTETGQAAEAKATGDAIDELNERLDNEGLSEDAKVALLNCFAHVAWIDEHGQDYYDALEDALYPTTGLVSITAVFTQGSAIIYPSTPLNDLKAYLVVTGHYNDGTSKTISDYALIGTLSEGTSTITISASGKTTTFTVVVSAPYWDYEWDASSGVAPADKNGNYMQGSFVDGLFKIGVVTSSEFEYAEIAPIECEIEWMASNKYTSLPYFSFCYNSGSSGGSGFKVFRSLENDNWTTSVPGVNTLSNIAIPVNNISIVKAISQSGNCQVDLDGNVITGSGIVDNQYLLSNSIGYALRSEDDVRIKSIKYKYL